VLLGGLFTVFAGSVDPGAVKFAHGLQLVINVAMTTNLVQYVYGKCGSSRGGSHWSRWMPCYLMLLAAVLMITQPLAIFIADSWGCSGRFTADQIGSHVSLCTGRDSIGALEPADCGGYYEMDGSFTSTKQPPGGAVRARAFSGIPSGCTNAFDDWMGSTVGAHYQVRQLILYGMYVGFISMFAALVLATGVIAKLRSYWSAIR